ncbi:methyl-accepting chemotaxis protein [Planomonospora sphaerica]|uniref:Methyl-accepting chemotaxis protein n=1 Tax=Planomonospora sphaerica TaxID=161355 RepID=A0A161LP18_9ACTN|nr:methyl-accepting chemotaxis protein [Planomonospora sphaerica]GAT71307.1 methyl-accepting chemotaxis protein [Planomonospora sphaerica]
MSRLIGRWKVGTRLIACFSMIVALFGGAALVGLNALRTQDAAIEHMEQMTVLGRDVQEIKYFNSDVSGWQVAYAWEAALGDPAAAVKADAASRAGYLEVVGRLRKHLQSVDTTAMTAEEKKTFQTLIADWDAFLAMDDKIADLFAKGTRAALEEANTIIGGASWDIYYRIMENTDRLVDSATARSDAAADGAAAASRSAKIQMGAAVLAALVMSVPLLRLLRRSITVPLAESTGALKALAAKDLTRQADTSAMGGELHEMGTAINEAVGVLRGAVTQIKTDAQQLSRASEAMRFSATRIVTSSDTATSRVENASAAAGEVSGNAQLVASGAREMGLSIQEISKSASEAATVAGEAVAAADSASTRVQRLSTSSSEIGAVVKAINAIAEQTNLLALNATIEAARAGDAGKGFAVVAGEVKDLAQETARATEDIAARVKAIQSDSDGAVEIISGFQDVIGKINTYVTAIAGAVEEQSATTAGMSNSVSDAASGSTRIADHISAVAETVSQAHHAVKESMATIDELAVMAEQMNEQAKAFNV